MENELGDFIHIEFFHADDCPYCPSVRKMLAELIKSELGMYIIIEEININTPAGMNRIKNYKNFKGVPCICLDGIMKFVGIPYPDLLFNEVKRIIEESRISNPEKPSSSSDSTSVKSLNFPPKDTDKFTFYT